MVSLGKCVWHIICQLADAVQCSIPNLWILMFEMLDNDRNHHVDLFDLIYIFAYL